MKNHLKALPVTLAILLGLSASVAMAADNDTLKNERNKTNAEQSGDKPDPYVVEDSKEKGLTNTKQPVRKLDHKQKTKGVKPTDSSYNPNAEVSGVTEPEHAGTTK